MLPAVLSSVSPSQSTSVWPSTSKSQDASFASASALASNSKLEDRPSWRDSEEYLKNPSLLSDPVNYAKYYFLKKKGNVPLQTRIKIADLFCDYVFELC